MLKGRKNGCHLHFRREVGTNNWGEPQYKTISFDLRDNKFYRELKSGALKVVADTGVATFFRGIAPHQVAESFDDEVWSKLIRMVINNAHHHTSHRGREITSFATMFSFVSHYLQYESYLLLGIKFEKNAFGQPVNQFPKQIVRFMRESGIIFNRKWEVAHNKNPKMLNDLCTHVRREHYMDLEVYRMLYSIVCGYGDNWENFNTLVGSKNEKYGQYEWSKEYGYGCEYRTLFNYLVKIARTEAQEASVSLVQYRDYLKMTREMENKKVISRMLLENPNADVTGILHAGYGRIEKYPINLAVRHNVVARNYRDFATAYDDLVFASNANQDYSYSHGDYQIIVPKVSQDIKDEGTALHHCVASYISRVLDGTTQIVFLRKNADESLVTVEIREGDAMELVQARGYNNRDLEPEELAWLAGYAKAKNLNYGKIKRDASKATPTPNVKKVELAEAA